MNNEKVLTGQAPVPGTQDVSPAPKPQERRRGRLVVAIALALGLAATGGLTLLLNRPAAAAIPAASVSPDVDVTRVSATEIVDWQDYSGRLQAVDDVAVRPQVSGKIIKVHFTDGANVREGDVLFTIDPRPYQAEVSRATADLAAAEAKAGYASLEMARAQRLIGANAISRSDLEVKQSDARAASASVLAAKARLEAARINLAYTVVAAPVSGRVSRAEVTVGNIVDPGSNAPVLTSLVSTDRLYASFDVDEQTFLKYIDTGRNGKPMTVRMALASEDGHPRTGTISSVDNHMDTSSGTVRVRALFDNTDGRLMPGLYAKIQIGGAQQRAILIDEKAIGTDQNKQFVLVTDAKGKTAYREVQLGGLQDGKRIVESGVQAGDRVIVSGWQSVRPGDLVKPHEVAADGSPLPPTTGSAHAVASQADDKAAQSRGETP